MSIERISVVLPVYNERDNIAACLRGLWNALREHEHEILICYDFDEDTTLGALRAMPDAPPTVRLVKNDLGRGAANALRAGFAAATGDVVVTTMADLSDPPELIPAMAAKVRRDRAVVVSGSRYMPGGSQSGGPLVKSAISRAACLSLRWIAGVGTHDATTNFKAYSREFLARTPVESTSAFDIALELTVKAHLAGEVVAEVPSSWVERSHGASRFRVWAWAPQYGRWWARAMAEPALVWGLLAALSVWSALDTRWTNIEPAAHRTVVAAIAASAAAWILAARVVRGRMRAVDAVHALIWLPPWQFRWLDSMSAGAHLSVAALASAALLSTSVGMRATRATVAAAVRHLRWHRALVYVSYAAVAIVVWLERFILPMVGRSIALDASWCLAYPYFFERSLRAGVDYVFTYGPLGLFACGQFITGQFWTRVIIWGCVFEPALAIAYVALAPRIRPWWARALYLAFVVVAPFHPDGYFLSVIAVVTAHAIMARRYVASTGCFAFFVGAMLGLVKFSFFPLALVSAAAIATVRASRDSLGAGLRSALTALAVTGAIWFAAGQTLGNVLPFLRGSMEIARGYSEAMGVRVPALFFDLTVVATALAAVQIGRYAFARPRDVGRAAIAVVLLAGLTLGYKASSTRHAFDGPFFPFVITALFIARPPAAAISRLARCADIAVVAATALLWWFSLPFVRTYGAAAPRRILDTIAEVSSGSVRSLSSLGSNERDLEQLLSKQERQFNLPRMRAQIGGAPVDMFGSNQALVLRNHFEYTPRPAFQSYAAYTPDLIRANAEFYTDRRAPAFVIARLQQVDDTLPALADSGALIALLRDYAPLFVERGFLLMRHEPRARSEEPVIVLEREVPLDEWIDLGPLDGACHLVSLDLRRSLRGDLRAVFTAAPRPDLELRTTIGEMRFTIPPQMMRERVLLDPVLRTQWDLTRWQSGESAPRLQALRIVDDASSFEPTAKLIVWRAPDLEPRPPPNARRDIVYSMFATSPDRVVNEQNVVSLLLHNREALLVPTQSELSFDVAAGKHSVGGEFGVWIETYVRAPVDSTGFRIGVGDQTLLERVLDPSRVVGERPSQTFELEFETERPTQLWLRTYAPDGARPAPARAYWLDVGVDLPAGRRRARSGAPSDDEHLPTEDAPQRR